MKRLALVASFCGIAITQMMAQNINGEQISDTTLFDKFSKELGEVVVKAHLPQYKKTHEGLLTNVAGTVLSKMGTAEDVLKHVPSIVKKKDGYEVVGKGNTMNVYLAKEQHVLDVSISKSFLKDALTLEIKGNDLLYKCWDADLLYNQKMELLQVSKRGTRDLQLTLRYKFNTTRSKYKGTGAGNAELNRL